MMHGGPKLPSGGSIEKEAEASLEGEQLFQTLAELSGLPLDVLRDEVERMAQASGVAPTAGNLTLEQLRSLLLCYLESLTSFGGSPAPVVRLHS